MNSDPSKPRYMGNGEISLVELFGGLWQQKWLVFGVTIAVTLCALVYSLVLTPIYESKARTIPPRAADVAPLNLGRDQAGLSELDAEEVYELFSRNLRAENTRRKFFVEYYRPFWAQQGSTASRDELVQRMRKDVVIHRPDERNNPFMMEVIVRSNNAEIAAEWNNVFVQLAGDAALRDLQASTELQVSNEKTVLDRRIEVLRELATTHREDRIARLQDALVVAEAVGAEAPQVVAGRTAADEDLARMIDGSLSYMRGSRAIKAELQLLQARENDDPYITELRDLQQQRNLLDLVEPAPENAALFTLDQAAEVPDGPIRPRKTLIATLGFLLGGILGLALALIRFARASERVRVSNRRGSA